MANYCGYGQTAPSVSKPSVLLNGWGANAHVGDYEAGVNQGHSNPLVTDPGTTSAYSNPTSAVDYDPTTFCSVAFVSTHQYAGCIWSGWSSMSTPGGATLSVVTEVPAAQTQRDAELFYSLDGGTTAAGWTLFFRSTLSAKAQVNVTLPANVDLTKLQVMAFTDSHDNMAHNVYDIFVTVSSPATNSAVYPVDSGLIGKYGAFNGGYQGMTFCKNIFVLQRDFWDTSLSTPYSGQLFPTGGNSGGPGQVYPF